MGERRWHSDARSPNGGFWVETMNPLPRQKRQKLEQAFAKVPLQWAAVLAKDSQTRSAMVWIVLLHLAWKHKSLTFPFSNEILAKLGIDRKMKYRMLAKLEKAGRIKIQHQGKQAPLVTLVPIAKSNPKSLFK